MSEGLRKRRKSFFVPVPSETVRDGAISFKALGILTYVLDKPDGWDVRSEQLATRSKDGEGREAIRSGLKELGKAGYYRLERRRLRSGRVVMGTAVSEAPVKSWAKDYAEHYPKPVPVIEQSDGRFLVLHKDGTLTDDGFVDEPVDEADKPATDGQSEDVSAGQTGDGFSGAGEPDAGFPGAGEPGAGEPDAGFPGPFSSTGTEDSEVKDPDSSLRSESAASGSDEKSETLFEQPNLKVVPDQSKADPEPGSPEWCKKRAAEGATWWWAECKKRDIKIMKRGSSRPFFALRDNVLKPAFEAGYDAKQIADALKRIGEPVPAYKHFERVLQEVDGKRTPQYAGRPGNGPSNLHVDSEEAVSTKLSFG